MIVKCRYCGNTLTEKDKICPSCGAPNEEIAEYFKEQAEHRRELEKINAQTRLDSAQRKVNWEKEGARLYRTVRIGCLIPIILFVAAVIIVAFNTIKSEKEIRESEISAEREAESIQQEELERERTMAYANMGEWCEKNNYRVMVDDARAYEFNSDHHDLVFGVVGKTIADDESRIAVHIIVENISDADISVNPSLSITDENRLQGKRDGFHIYTSFNDERLDDNDIDFEGHELADSYNLASGNKMEGWSFFIVNTKSKTLTLRYCDYSEITFDNPAYGYSLPQ